jgi:hypothetical protein
MTLFYCSLWSTRGVVDAMTLFYCSLFSWSTRGVVDVMTLFYCSLFSWSTRGGVDAMTLFCCSLFSWSTRGAKNATTLPTAQCAHCSGRMHLKFRNHRNLGILRQSGIRFFAGDEAVMNLELKIWPYRRKNFVREEETCHV